MRHVPKITIATVSSLVRLLAVAFVIGFLVSLTVPSIVKAKTGARVPVDNPRLTKR